MKLDFERLSNSPEARRDRSRPVVLVGFLLLIAVLIFVVRPLSHRSPTIDILGSYFPAWMVCILSGLTLTLITHWFIQLGNLKPYLGPLPLIYPSLMIILTFTTWILLYQN